MAIVDEQTTTQALAVSVHGWFRRLVPASIRARLEGRPNFGKVLANTAWLSADRVFQLTVGLVVGVWVARYLGPEQYGLLSYASAFVALFSAFATLGLDSIVVRDLVDDPSKTDELLGTIFVLRLCGGIVVLVLATAAISVVRPGEDLVRYLVALASGATALRAIEAVDLWFQSRVESKNTVIVKDLAFSLVAVARVTLVLRGASVLAFAWASFMEVVLAAVGLAIVYHRKGMSIRRWRPSVARAEALLTEGWPLMVSGLAVMIYMRFGQVILGELAGDEAVGLYSAATRISELWYFVPMAIVSSVFPSLIQAKKVSEELYLARLQRLFALLSALALAVAVPMSFLSGPLMALLYGPSYAGAGPILSIHIWAGVFVCLGVAQSPWDVAEGLTGLKLMRTLLGAVVAVGLSFALIPRMAGTGAAIAAVASYAVASCLGNALDRRTRPILVLQATSLLLMPFRNRSI